MHVSYGFSYPFVITHLSYMSFIYHEGIKIQSSGLNSVRFKSIKLHSNINKSKHFCIDDEINYHDTKERSYIALKRKRKHILFDSIQLLPNYCYFYSINTHKFIIVEK